MDHLNDREWMDEQNFWFISFSHPEFEGLTTQQVDDMIHRPMHTSPVCIRPDIPDEVLDRIPLFRLAEAYLHIVQRDGEIKLSKLGALPKKVVVELYDLRILPEPMIEAGFYKVSAEDRWIALRSARIALQQAGIVKKVHGRITLTKWGGKLLADRDRNTLFLHFLQAYANKFNWGYNDCLPNPPIGQVAWTYTLYLLRRFGDEPRPAIFYARRYLKAFPDFLPHFENSYCSLHEMCYDCYTLRTFPRFLEWFGFVSITGDLVLYRSESVQVTPTPLLWEVFEAESEGPQPQGS